MTLEGRHCTGPGHSLLAFILPQKRGHPSWDLTSFTTSAQQTLRASWDPRPGLVMSDHSLTP